MKTMEAENLQANIEEVIREVESGHIVEVTRHGEVVARWEYQTFSVWANIDAQASE